MNRLPKVCVIGAGAIGGFFGAQLAQGHAEVSVIARGATLAALRRDGWIFESGGRRSAAKVNAIDTPHGLGAQDIVILAVKAYALEDVAALVPPLLGPETLVLPALNGVPWWFTQGLTGGPVPVGLHSLDPAGTIAAAIPADRIMGSVVYPACSSPAPGVARHASGSRLVFGEMARGASAAAQPSPRLDALVKLLQAAGMEAEASADIRSEVWKKLLGNACFNPVSMLTGASTDRLIDDPEVHALFAHMMEETLAVGRALGLDVAIQAHDRIAVTRKLGQVKTSMLQDSEAGRPVEIDAILGAVNELAKALGVPTPHNTAVHALAKMRARTFGLLKQ